MCGINGFYSSINLNCQSIIKLMNNQILHRGPDDAGIFITENIALGMQRLAIIDLESGRQPMYSSDRSIIIVFNGEIYNYKILKLELENKGCVFQTESDTEVILKGYELFGNSYFSQLNGMFAIGLYDRRIGKLIIVRDRLGEKPLYYFIDNNNFVFASELKSILIALKEMKISKPLINFEAISIYFSLSYIPAPFTIYEGVKKLEPGRILEYDLNIKDISQSQYWNIPVLSNKKFISTFDEAKKMLQNLLYDSVEKRMLADVPVGAFLSGGVDSSIIAAIMSDLNSSKPIETFTIGFRNKDFDESGRAQIVANHIQSKHRVHYLDYDDLSNVIDRVLLNYDEPFADSSALPTYLVSQITREHVKVALTGDGGDEVFGGYNRYDMALFGSLFRKFIPNYLHDYGLKPLFANLKLKKDNRGSLFKIKKFINGVSSDERNDVMNIMSLGFLITELSPLLKESKFINWSDYYNKIYNQTSMLSSLDRARFIDIKISLEGDMLTKVDRASMLASLECRTPMLDHRLVEFSFNLPDKFLINNRSKKYLLKESFKHLLPNNYFNSKKSGFGIPVGDWLRTNLRADLEKLTSYEFIEGQNIFNYAYIKYLVQNHINSIDDNTFKVWTIYCFQKWWIKNYGS